MHQIAATTQWQDLTYTHTTQGTLIYSNNYQQHNVTLQRGHNDGVHSNKILFCYLSNIVGYCGGVVCSDLKIGAIVLLEEWTGAGVKCPLHLLQYAPICLPEKLA